jgi:hypothetical protein
VNFSTRGVQKHHKKMGAIYVENFLPKKLREQKIPVVFPLRFFFIAFWAVSLHDELKNTIKTFKQIRHENLKNLKKK